METYILSILVVCDKNIRMDDIICKKIESLCDRIIKDEPEKIKEVFKNNQIIDYCFKNVETKMKKDTEEKFVEILNLKKEQLYFIEIIIAEIFETCISYCKETKTKTITDKVLNNAISKDEDLGELFAHYK